MSNTKSSRRSFIKTAAAGAAGLAINSRALSAEQPTPGQVLVTFEGAMVFHPLQASHEYEVGVLVRNIAPCHIFSVKKNGTPVDAGEGLLFGNSWQLDVVNGTSTVGAGSIHSIERPIAPNGRLSDSSAIQNDLSWMVDFEGYEFHSDRLIGNGHGGHELRMDPGLLKPIIRLSSGELSTLYKIEKLTRQKGTGPIQDFGFMTETVGLKIILKKGEALVLRVPTQNPAGFHEIFKLWYSASGKDVVEIENFVPKKERRGHGSHFQVYYELFPDIPCSERYEIALACPKPLPRKTRRRLLDCTDRLPLNPHPDAKKKGLDTIADYPCGGIRLGTRTRNLE